MYIKNFPPQNKSISAIPPDYGGNAFFGAPDADGCAPPPQDVHCAPPPPRRETGIFDLFSMEDILLFGAAALLTFRDGSDAVALIILLFVILV